MAETLHVVNRERHRHKKWLRPSDYHFAATFHTAPVGADEITSAARAFPLGFVEAEGKLSLVALFSLVPGRNLFVAPNGQWLAAFVPAALKAYPFALGRRNDGELALCVDEASDLIKDAAVGEVGYPFFDEDGAPSRETLQFIDALAAARRGFDAANIAVEAIVAHGLLEPWPLAVKDETGERRIHGIARINESALNALGANDLQALRDSAGLAVAYCQLLSMGNMSLLGLLAGVHERTKAQRMTIPPNSFVAEDDGDLKIDWSLFLKDE